jgi:hypothetical protein
MRTRPSLECQSPDKSHYRTCPITSFIVIYLAWPSKVNVKTEIVGKITHHNSSPHTPVHQ